jgi:hypothetical protein
LVLLFIWCSLCLSAELLWMTLEQHARGESPAGLALTRPIWLLTQSTARSKCALAQQHEQ